MKLPDSKPDPECGVKRVGSLRSDLTGCDSLGVSKQSPPTCIDIYIYIYVFGFISISIYLVCTYIHIHTLHGKNSGGSQVFWATRKPLLSRRFSGGGL